MIYLVLFERQIKRAKISQENCVTHLISLLPIDVLIRHSSSTEGEEVVEDYNHFKQTLLKRHKLNAENFKFKFMNHQKRSGDNWKDCGFELRNYLNGWLASLNVFSYEDLKTS